MFVSIRRANRRRLDQDQVPDLPWKGFWLGLLGLGVIFGVVWLWSHIQVWQLAVEHSRLQRERVKLLSTRRTLKLELAALKNPARLQDLNRRYFHLNSPRPGQVEERP
jgi:cell division protein FtsL